MEVIEERPLEKNIQEENEQKSLVGTRTLKTHLAEEDRPREKALHKGFQSLTTAELMACIIGSGTPGESVVDLCQRIISDNSNKLYMIARRGLKELMGYKGIGDVKALQLLAALEISRRYQLEKFDEQVQIRTSMDAYQYLRQLMEHLDHEELWILVLNRAKRVVDRVRVSTGGTSATVGDIKIILKAAIEKLADGIILSHNHPSDNPRPSAQDNELTKKLKEACQLVDIPLVDHIIVCRGNNYYSYCDHGLL